LAGNGASDFTGEGGLATSAKLTLAFDITVGPDGGLYLIDDHTRVRRVAPPLAGFSVSDILLPSEDGRELYVFNATGRHLKTLDALTSAVRYQFNYDPAGYLTSVADGSGNVTTIERTGAVPLAIVAPGGQRTTFSLSSNGWLIGVTNSAGESHTMSYSVDGLLQQFVNSLGNTNRFTYD